MNIYGRIYYIGYPTPNGLVFIHAQSICESNTQPPITDNTTASKGPSTATDQTSTDNPAAIIGGVVAVVLIIAITVVIVIVVLVMKNRRGDLFLKNSEK